MASEVIAFQVNLRKNNNRFNKGYGKYYPEADSKEPLNLKGFARHISEPASTAAAGCCHRSWPSRGSFVSFL
jgi:hypothetical protein